MPWLGIAAFVVLIAATYWALPGWIAGAASIVLVADFVYRMIAASRPAKILVDEEGVSIRGHWGQAAMAWRDIHRIEVSRYPTATVDVFCVQFNDEDDDGLSVFGFYKGFAAFEAEMFKRWPGIVDGWKRVFAAPPSEAEFTPLWSRS